MTSLPVPGSLAFAVRVALPLNLAAPYVAAAYGVFVILIGVYIGIMARRQRASQRQASELLALMREQQFRDDEPEARREPLGVKQRQ